MKSPSPPASASSRRGFSLPEVAISLGIAATALLTLISMLPFGQNILRDAGNKQAESRIIQSVISGYQTGAWVYPGDGSSSNQTGVPQDRTFFFDQTGTELESGSDFACNYVVRVLMGVAPVLQGSVSDNQYLRQLKVRITDRPAGYKDILANDNGKAGEYRERSVWVVRLDLTGPMSSSMNLTGL